MRLGLGEIILIAVVILFVIKPEKAGEYTKAIISAWRVIGDEVKAARAEMEEPLREVTKGVKEEVQEMAGVIKEAVDDSGKGMGGEEL